MSFFMASNVCHPQEHDTNQRSSKLQVTILASEWGSSHGWVSTIIRELAIQLAKFANVKLTFFLPTGKCSKEDKKAAEGHGICIREAIKRPGYNELEWLSFPPKDLSISVVVGHGIKLGRQAQFIRDSHNCKWVQVAYTDAVDRGRFQSFDNRISVVEEEHQTEVLLCKMADLVVGVGPKLTDAFRRYLCWCKNDESIYQLTPGVFSDLFDIEHVLFKRKHCILVCGHGDAEDFKGNGFDIAAISVAAVPDTQLRLVTERKKNNEEITKKIVNLGIPETHLMVTVYKDSPDFLRRLFCEVDLLLMPSRTEGFGLIGLQALSAGLPVIVSKKSGFGEALDSVTFGSSFVIDSEDTKKWTEAIKRILEKGRESPLQEVKTARDSYDRAYSWSEQCKGLIKKMVNCLDGMSHI